MEPNESIVLQERLVTIVTYLTNITYIPLLVEETIIESSE